MGYFTVNDHLQINAYTYETRYSWGHKATIYRDNQEIARTKITYYNRTWERYTYESILEKLADITKKQKLLNPEEQARFEALIKNQWAQDELDKVNKQFGMIAGIAKMGEILGETKKQANDWKKRMLQAGLPGLDMPEDWETLSEDEKTNRLDNVIGMIQGEK